MPFPWNKDEECPERGAGLSHIRDLRKRGDGGCIYCGYGGRVTVCKGFTCTRNVAGDYCIECLDLRAVHALSHKWEGHPESVRMCPDCEE